MGEVKITEHEKYVEYSLSGTLDDQTIWQMFQDLWTSGDYERNQPELYDFRAVDVSRMSTSGVRSINKLNRSLHSAVLQHPVALLAEEVLEHFYSRLVIRLSEDRKANIKVFRDRDEAVAWIHACE